ncbi:Gamma-glutamylaminecyclotransferase C [Halotydeus destructor]|nr:Gamma-glutamylaminecyclotransferase C [Halotydeus destructor]
MNRAVTLLSRCAIKLGLPSAPYSSISASLSSSYVVRILRIVFKKKPYCQQFSSQGKMAAESGQWHRIFVYGTLKTGQPNFHHMTDVTNGQAKLVCQAVTSETWPLVIGSKRNIPFLLNEPGLGKRIIGEVYDVDSDKLAFLDEFEAYPEFYGRKQIECISSKSGETIRASVYYLAETIPKLLELPFMDNYDSDGDHGLPYEYNETSTTFEDHDSKDKVISEINSSQPLK